MAHAMSRELTNAEVAVFAAIQRGDYGDVCAFLKKLGNVNIADPAKKTSEYTYTLVHATLEAFCTGRHAIENYLKLGKDAKTTQVQALCKTQLEILDLVLRTRFDAMQVCSQDATTLPTLTMRWVEPPHTVAFFKVLMHRDHTHSGIKPNMCDLVPGQPCVFEAVQRRNFEAATFFFAHGIEVTTMNEDGECLLYNAVMRRDLLAVEFLLRQTDINVNQLTF
ncbi:hypothetical protein SDRG_02860 [Saprolegnia diclina VS20]|uniref:Uncharacterized protein n=1 Tax=Saprolegnia diclina (strain VS20) TaxID=1156394 RepID=T0SBR1_SAPDV|nr:hypothetical protein SDRG_02860 [Saprolegnia diclina VS20]EQC40212.1 hypothetical protein SDRG_02860 [Saprolegnia diclina VS20]|eukprot:XP_008606686.1 hypothetical protein SDRG_02860 [Saprolegnia diclina VS20]